MARFGSLGTQYFDDAGDPLVNGKIYFFDSGTDTPKTTYADVNQQIPNSNPVLLSASGRQPNVFFSGSARAILTKDDDTQVEVRDPVGGDISPDDFGDYNGLLVYNFNDIVKGGDDRYYTSIINNNVGNDPISTVGFWMEIRFINVWDTTYPYQLGYVAIADDDNLYLSLSDNNVGFYPPDNAGFWKILNTDINTFTGMLWEDQWASDATYAQSDTVRDGLWTMTANVNTSERPAPQSSLSPEPTLPSIPAWVDETNGSSIESGQRYTFSTSGIIEGFKVWVPDTTDRAFSLLITDESAASPIYTLMPLSDLTSQAWNVIDFVALVPDDTSVWTAQLITYDSTIITPTVSAPWDVTSLAGGSATVAGTSVIGNAPAILSLSKTDNNAVSQAVALATLTAGSRIRLEADGDPSIFYDYLVLDVPVDGGSYFDFPVTLVGSDGSDFTGLMDVVGTPSNSATVIAYSELEDYWLAGEPAWATVEGLLSFAGLPESVPNNAYGVDLVFTVGYVPVDWELVGYSGSLHSIDENSIVRSDLADGTVEGASLRWDDSAQEWVETTAITQTASGALEADSDITSGASLVGKRVLTAAVNNGNSGTIDLETGEVFQIAITGATSIIFNNEPSAGIVSFATIELTNAGAFATTFPAGTLWVDGVEPTWTVAGLDIASLYSVDGGVSYKAAALLDVK